MPDLSSWAWSTWALIVVAALVVGILAGHFGWGKRWTRPFGKLHPDYLAGLDYLVSEQPDRALDMFLKLMDANSDTIETHFALGALYRRRGEVERAIRIHQNLLAREALPREHREQALLALAQDYLRAGLLDRAEGLLQQVSEVPRLRAERARRAARRLRAPARVAAGARHLPRSSRAPRRRRRASVAAHYLCELAALAIERERHARRQKFPTRGAPRGRAVSARRAAAGADRRARIAARARVAAAAARRSTSRPALLPEELPHLLRARGRGPARCRARGARGGRAISRGAGELKSLVFAAIGAGLAAAAPLRAAIETVFAQDPTLACRCGAPPAAISSASRTRSARCWLTPSAIVARSAASRGAAFTGIVPRVSRGKVSRPMRWSNCD